MPARARRIPPRLPASMELFLQAGAGGGRVGDGFGWVRQLGKGRPCEGLEMTGTFSEDAAAIGDSAVDYLFAGFEDDDFFPLMRVSMVSGEASAYLMRSLLTTRGLPLSRVR